MFGDSFSGNMIPWLSGYFRELHCVGSARVRMKIIDEVKPDIVILEMVARYIHFFPVKLVDLD